MAADGLVMFNDEPIGTFKMDEFGKATIDLENSDRWVDLETALQFATDQGSPLGLMLNPTFGEE